ncbi:MAG: flotillin family protein, partial [Acidobacteria bacterium]|nr:flotillin family protein [Acidobacteriota bacterium]
ARRRAEVEIQKAQYLAEQERLNAEEVVQKEIDKRKIEISAEAEAEKTRREARGQADAILLRYTAEAEGIRKVLESKAAGYRLLVESCVNDAKSAATLLMIEKIEAIVARQVEAIKNLKIDKVTVWDSGAAGGSSSTAAFLSNLIKSLPPLHEVARMAGVELPDYLGHVAPDHPAAPKPPAADAPPAAGA